MTSVLPLLFLGMATAACQASADEPALSPPTVVAAAQPPAVQLVPFFGGATFRRPLDARQQPGADPGWTVVEQRGTAWRMIPGIAGWVRRPFLDISERVNRKGNEEGLLGLAYSPHFGREGHPHARAVYVNYSVEPGQKSRLARFLVRADSGEVDPDSEQILLEVEQPWRNHNGGGLVFGPDGYLYYSLGDGGFRADPNDNGQDPGTLLGSILRLDVDPRSDELPYGIPADNPLVGREGARPEVWAFGLRNAWRFCFDRQTGEMWAADVGQDRFESVFVVRPGGNHGWNLLEGFHRFALDVDEPVPPGLVGPVFAYPHEDGLSITGGFLYRGSNIPKLRGWYVFADYVTRTLWAIRRLPDGSVEHATLLRDAAPVSSFAQGLDGELLVISHAGPIYRLMPAKR